MKAVVLHAYGPPSNLKYEDFADPTAGPGEVLIRVHAAGVNPIDWKIRSGATASRFTTTFPAILGYDFAGTVHALGEGVTGFAAGDRVFGRTVNCYAELTTVKASELAKVPEGLDLTVAGALATPVTTADQLIHEAVNAQPGQTILLTGALGSVGHVALFAAIESGVKVIAGVRKQEIDKAIALGATAAIDVNDDAALQSLGVVDAVADTIGGTIGQRLLHAIKPGGTYASVVGPPRDAEKFDVRIALMTAQPDASRLAELALDEADGEFNIPIEKVMPLSEVRQAQELGEKGGLTGKIILIP